VFMSLLDPNLIEIRPHHNIHRALRRSVPDITFHLSLNLLSDVLSSVFI